jgi:hypothetical protein
MRTYPIRVVQFAAALSLIATWVLAASGFALGRPRLYTWSGRMLIATLVVALIPLVAFLVGVVIERIRGDRPS